MTITDWCGNLMFVTATFRRTTSYGMVVTEPLASGQVVVQRRRLPAAGPILARPIAVRPGPRWPCAATSSRASSVPTPPAWTACATPRTA